MKKSPNKLSKWAEEYMSPLLKMELMSPFLNNYHYLNFCFTKATQIKNGKKAYPIDKSAVSIVDPTAIYNSLCP